MKTTIPDGFGEFLQNKVGGTLVAPARGNPCGHRVDSTAHLKSVPVPVTDEQIIAAVHEYYGSYGTVTRIFADDLCFGVEMGKICTLFVSLSNFTQDNRGEISRILLTVDMQSLS